MVWEILIGVILAIGILTTINEIRLKRARKKLLTETQDSQDTELSQLAKKGKARYR